MTRVDVALIALAAVVLAILGITQYTVVHTVRESYPTVTGYPEPGTTP
jgi:uncharacterized protein YqiB (DUF1249 family)